MREKTAVSTAMTTAIPGMNEEVMLCRCGGEGGGSGGGATGFVTTTAVVLSASEKLRKKRERREKRTGKEEEEEAAMGKGFWLEEKVFRLKNGFVFSFCLSA